METPKIPELDENVIIIDNENCIVYGYKLNSNYCFLIPKTKTDFGFCGDEEHENIEILKKKAKNYLDSIGFKHYDYAGELYVSTVAENKVLLLNRKSLETYLEDIREAEEILSIE